MGYKELQIKIPVNFHEGELKKLIEQQIGVLRFSYQIIGKSLDARNKRNLHWQMRLGVSSGHIKDGEENERPGIKIEYKKKNKKVVVVGAGPAGFFAAYLLQMFGFDTEILERGTDVDKRAKGILQFEKTGKFDPVSNYAFGEGGAGTFSDGKLTSRSKHISKERNFIIDSYIAAGAPEEIKYLAHPHVGSDILKKVVKNLRDAYIQNGGEIRFETLLTDFISENGRVKKAVASYEKIETDYLVIAPGHSSYETYHMLIDNGVSFRTKNFAIGSRAEHRQEIINKAQWGVEKLKGVKAAEYRLTSGGDGKHSVYTFCMCPGGIVVPATPYENSNIVNGMSYYARNGTYANAACVASMHPDQLAGKKATPGDALKHLNDLEQLFYNKVGGYSAPFCSITDCISGTEKVQQAKSSYPLGLNAMPLHELLPDMVVKAMREGLKEFCKKVRGYDTGILLGLESKTSAPVQVLRDKEGCCEGFDNLYVVGEGSGYAGGIISSAADGVKIAMNIVSQC